MSLLDFVQLIIRNKKWVIYFPLIVGIGVFLLTRNIPKTYTSQMVIYTGIASGFNPDNDFENKIDFHAVNSRFDNLINIIGSRETRTEVGIKLLTYMLHNNKQLKDLLENSKNSKLNAVINDAFIAHYKKSDEIETEEYLMLQLAKGSQSEIYQLIYGDMKNPFNVKTLEDIKAERVGFSDMLKISYTCEDPFTCKKTLDITTDIFLRTYKDMRVGEANQAVKYFREQTALAKGKLEVSEQSLKAFRSENRVINYYEQTKYIADQNEDISKNIFSLEEELEGYQTALAQVQSKISNRFLVQLQSDKIVQTTNSLASELTKAGLDAVKTGTVSTMNTPQIENLKGNLKESVDKLYSLNNTTEGLPGKKLLDQWLDLTINKQETEAKLKVLNSNKEEFDKVFERYAPMGSELNKLEREVETAEKEYLNLLHSLNQAILRERNLEVSENVSVIDDADLPLVPNPSKRFILVIAGVMSCLIISIALLIIKEYIDNSLASPLRMEKITGLKAATAFMAKHIAPTTLNEMDTRAMERWQITMENKTGKNGSAFLAIPFNCTVAFMQGYLDKMAAFMTEQGQPMKVINIKEAEGANLQHCFIVSEKTFAEQQPPQVMEQIGQLFLFFDASQKLDEYQMQMLDGWKTANLSIKGVLVNTNEQHISKYLGEIPRKRSRFRAFIKKQFKRYAG
ncbi:MAG TPA: GNVR domain-containing protein [Chitinophagales bacterium]|nr:GNVR domain-containing protein [Chitinophagales bacterium]